MRVAAIQMVSTPVLQENLDAASRLLHQAAEQGAELAVLPEYFCLLGRKDSDKLAVQEAFGQGPIQQFLSQTARALGIWLVGGTLPLSTGAPDRVFNSSLAFSPDGHCAARYDKIHLFAFDNGAERYDEARVLERGRQPVWFDLDSHDGMRWRIGMSVCYDLRFPELYRQHMRAGAHLLLAPSAFTYTTGQAHWEILLRARAIENLCCMMAPAQGGRHANGRRTWGHTMAIDAWGNSLGMLAENEGVVMADLDMTQLAQCRKQLPALCHVVL